MKETPSKSEEDKENAKAEIGTEKSSLQELWREPPQVDFPKSLFGKVIDLNEMCKDIHFKADELRSRIEQRKQ